MQRVTLKELSNNLPIGLKGREKKNFSFKSWGLNEEKHISEMKRKAGNMGSFVNNVLCYMVQDLAGENFAAKTNDEKMLTINQMKMMDILYVYIYLRYDQLDEHVRMDIGCPTCGKLNKDFVADLSGLDVDLPEATDLDTCEYHLKAPVKFGDLDIEMIKIARTPWDAMERANDEVTTNSGKLMELIFKHSIIGVNDVTGHIDVDKLMQNFKKRDLERLSLIITKHNAGPSLNVSDKCKYCRSIFFKQLDWSYDNFFGSSSLPRD